MSDSQESKQKSTRRIVQEYEVNTTTRGLSRYRPARLGIFGVFGGRCKISNTNTTTTERKITMEHRAKRCSKCGIVKPLRNFSRQPTGYMGRRANCKACQNEQTKQGRLDRQSRQQNNTQGTHCWCCAVELSTERLASQRLKIKQIAARGQGEPLPICQDCQWLSPQQRAAKRTRTHPEQVGMSIQAPHRPAPPPDPNAR